jgi:hypothetical protein
VDDDCCLPLWWCCDGVVTSGFQRPSAQCSGPWRTEAEATTNCDGTSPPPPPPPPPVTTTCCPDLPATIYIDALSTGDDAIPLVWDGVSYWQGHGTVGACVVEFRFSLNCTLEYRCYGVGASWVAAACSAPEGGSCFTCGPPFSTLSYQFFAGSMPGCGCSNFTGAISD